MTEHTPPLTVLRLAYLSRWVDNPEAQSVAAGEFDRCLAEHDREVRIAALNAAADDIDQVYSPSIPGTVAGFSAWLRKRGPVIFGGAVPDDVAPGGVS